MKNWNNKFKPSPMIQLLIFSREIEGFGSDEKINLEVVS